MLRRLFLDHPANLGESYGEHARTASSVGLRMVAGGLACFVHALVPRFFETTGSSTVARLHAEIVAGRARRAAAGEEMRTGGWVI